MAIGDKVVDIANELVVVLRKENLEQNTKGCRKLRGWKARAAWAMAKLLGGNTKHTHAIAREGHCVVIQIPS